MTKQILENEICYLDDDGRKLAFVSFAKESDILNIDKTMVDPSLKGQGIAKRLMEDIHSFAKDNGLKLKATCSFAISYFEKNPSVLYLK